LNGSVSYPVNSDRVDSYWTGKIQPPLGFGGLGREGLGVRGSGAPGGYCRNEGPPFRGGLPHYEAVVAVLANALLVEKLLPIGGFRNQTDT
jgi:hypothetical protein